MFTEKLPPEPLSPKAQIKLIQKEDLKKLSIFMEKFMLDETALAEVIKHSLWSVFCKELSKTTHKVSLSAKKFQSFYAYCSKHNQDFLKQFVEKHLLTADLQEVAVIKGYWDILIMQLKKFSWNFELTKDDFQSFYAYCKGHEQDALKLFVEKNFFTFELQEVAAQNGYWDIIAMQLRHSPSDLLFQNEHIDQFYTYCQIYDKDVLEICVQKDIFDVNGSMSIRFQPANYWDILVPIIEKGYTVESLYHLSRFDFQSFYTYCKKNAPNALYCYVKGDYFSDANLQNFAARENYWDILILQLEMSFWRDRYCWQISIDAVEFKNFYSYSKNNAPKAWYYFISRRLFATDSQKVAVQEGYWDILTLLLEESSWNFKLTSGEFPSFYSYCSEHNKNALKLFVKKNLFTKDLQEIAALKGYWDILIMQLKKFSWNFELTKDEFQDFYAYCSEHNQCALRLFVEENLFTKDLQEIALQKKYDLIFDEAINVKRQAEFRTN